VELFEQLRREHECKRRLHPLAGRGAVVLLH
jgi:hypothetical protein